MCDVPLYICVPKSRINPEFTSIWISATYEVKPVKNITLRILTLDAILALDIKIKIK